MLFKDKLCWVTGASSGIGEAIAMELARCGAKLIISSSNKDKLQRVQQNCLKHTSQCEAIPFDLSNPTEVESVAKQTVAKFGPIFLLVNNGGISQRALAHETSVEIDRKIMEIDYFSYVILTKTVLPGMIEANQGFIAATSSISGKFGFPLRSAYAAAKHAIQGFFETLRIELKPYNISITIAYPGRVNTNISLNAILKDGRAHGKMDDGQAGGMSAERCAKIYLKAIAKGKPEVLIGGKELLMVHVKRLFPSIFFKVINKINTT
ncbi:MAG: SDR family oxidoreductase [Tenuifilaceae bacterium]|nr:SDR family oxidoreductase [Tenuifilaceae bacterium]